MRSLTLSLCLLVLAQGSWAAPRLLVVISVDQFRGDFLDRFSEKFTGGIKELFEGGAVLTNAHHPHVPTATAVGHAAIMTGRFPGENGIVGNRWWDRLSRRTVKASDDSVHGKGPEQLLSYTLGDVLKAKHPDSIVVSVSLKPRSAIMMGGKKADAAIWFDEKKGKFATSSYYGKEPAWLDSFNKELYAKGGRLARKKRKHYEKLMATPLADRLVLDLAEKALLELPLGEDRTPDILAISFSGTDFVGHRYGPYSRRMTKQILALDGYIGELLDVLKSKVPRKDLAVVLTGDHGALPVVEGRQGKALKAVRVRSQSFKTMLEAGLQKRHPAPGREWLVKLHFPHVYLNRELVGIRGLEWSEFLNDAAEVVEGLEGVAKVFVFGTVDIRDPHARAYARSFHPARSGDLVIRPKRHASFTSQQKGTGHGSPYRYDTHVPIIFWGGDFRTGLFSQKTPVTDIAPTCAAWLGLEFPPANGRRVLNWVLKAL